MEEDLKKIKLTEEILYKNTIDSDSKYAVFNSEHWVQYNLGNNYAVKYSKDYNIFVYEGLVLETAYDLQQLMDLMRLERRVRV